VSTSKNLDLVRSIYADWERGDYSSIDWADPGIEFVVADGPSPGTWTGVTAMTEAARHLLSAWDEWRGEPEQYRELDDGRVLVLTQFSGRGKRSGVELEQIRSKGASLWAIRDGKVTRQAMYFDRERALADLGLASEGDSL
jgi:ketosteroid isomerase-like protein